jgi:hypothetical protein
MTPNGETVGDWLIPQLAEISRGGQLPPLIPGLSEAKILPLSD